MVKQDSLNVPGRDHYSATYLLGGRRLFSYAHQIESLLAFHPKRVLEVGVGTGIVSSTLKTVSIDVVTMDIKYDLQPDCVASVVSLPLQSEIFDVALCCQVLEHLPFNQFEQALNELARIAKLGVIISLPDAMPYYEIRLRLPKFRNIHCTFSRRYQIQDQYRKDRLEIDGHHWEIGYPGITLTYVMDLINESALRAEREWRVPEYPYHHFFVLRKRRVGA